ncbi:hypothetical protein J7E62_32550 [Variovorax paradoxus]|nr:hypothetical protein [Variovorax paradoxus]
MDTSMPDGTGIKPMRLDVVALRSSGATGSSGQDARGAVCTQRGSLTVVSNVVVPERMPENLPAQPQQYLARSVLGVWHDSQNFVIPALRMNFVPAAGQRNTASFGGRISSCGLRALT